MKIKRNIPLSEALDGISAMIDQLKSSTISVGDRDIQPSDHVEYELEIESAGEAFEIEFEIKWKGPQDQPGGEGEW